MAHQIRLRAAEPKDRDIIDDLLQSAGLPRDGLDDRHVELWVAETNGEPVGSAALEHRGRQGLLRSVAVQSKYRGRGIATDLVRHIEDIAASRAIETMWLLTTTAERFFDGLGYEPAGDDAIPVVVRRSGEFQGCATEGALLMKRSLRFPSDIDQQK